MTQLPLFSESDGERLKREGMAAASGKAVVLLGHARQVAVHVARAQGGQCNSDDVTDWFWRNLNMDLGRRLGPAMGSLFRGGLWEFTGERVRSQRTSNHVREIKVWRYTGDDDDG